MWSMSRREHVSFVHTRALGTNVLVVLQCLGQILKNRFFSTLGGRVSIKSVSCKLRFLERVNYAFWSVSSRSVTHVSRKHQAFVLVTHF